MICCNKYSVHDLPCDVNKNLTMPDRQSSDMRYVSSQHSVWHQLDLASCEFHS